MYEKYNKMTKVGHVCLYMFESTHKDTRSSEHGNNICAINCVHKCERLRACFYASAYPFVHICVMRCVRCVVVKLFASQVYHLHTCHSLCVAVSGLMMRTVFHRQLWYSWSPTVMVMCMSSVAALADRHHTHAKNYQFVTSLNPGWTISSSIK